MTGAHDTEHERCGRDHAQSHTGGMRSSRGDHVHTGPLAGGNSAGRVGSIRRDDRGGIVRAPGPGRGFSPVNRQMARKKRKVNQIIEKMGQPENPTGVGLRVAAIFVIVVAVMVLVSLF